MENNEKITLMQMQLKELKSLETANQSLIINRTGTIENELDDLRKQIEIVQQSINKLLESQGQSKQDKFKGNEFAHYKKCSDEQIYTEKYIDGLSWTQLVKRHGGSKTTMQRKCKSHMQNMMNMEVDF